MWKLLGVSPADLKQTETLIRAALFETLNKNTNERDKKINLFTKFV
jgi:hypothetical protein